MHHLTLVVFTVAGSIQARGIDQQSGDGERRVSWRHAGSGVGDL